MTPPRTPTAECEHRHFKADVTVNRLEDIKGFHADVRISCAECGAAFRFLGIPIGLDLRGPAVSVDGTEARLAIAPPSSEGPAPPPIGFTIRLAAVAPANPGSGSTATTPPEPDPATGETP